ncbi:MAG: oxygen-independent coproporphyrinogen III oxidase [Rhodospirillales bacterium]|nr:oxygen-independent coproporphyrinogen III oxidase [Rhodospirillales bacterium]
MTEQLVTRYGGSAPRYTSYPTAPHFHDGVTGRDYESWLQVLPSTETLSLYLHVPFCQRMCWYCGCQTKIAAQYQPVADYAKHLAMEIELVSKQLRNRPSVQHIHWGGGTPTILSADDFMALMNRLRTQFTISFDAEIAIEIDPRTMTREYAGKLAEAGVNRASLGVQDFNPDVQKAINRPQSFEQTRDVTEWLRDAGIGHINLDLMYGLPQQTVADVQRTVDLTMALDADRYSVFGYAHVPWMKTHQKQIVEADLPGAEDRLNQAAAIATRLQDNGYRAIGLDHFAKPDDTMVRALDGGRLHRNFQGYTTDSAATLIGLGASAIGHLPQGYVQNTASVAPYKAAIEKGQLPVARGIKLSSNDRLRRQIIERLMCDLAVDVTALTPPASSPLDAFGEELAQIRCMQADGLVELNDGVVQITDAGRPYVRAVCAVFDQYLDKGRGRHSRAV